MIGGRSRYSLTGTLRAILSLVTRMFLRGLLLLLSPDVDGHEGVPRPIRSQDRGGKYFVVGAFQLRHFSEFGRRLRTGNGAFRFPCQNISRDIERALILPEMAGHAIDHRSDVFFLRGV